MFSNQMGLNLLSLTDLYNASSMGGVTINNYSTNGGNMYAGDFTNTNTMTSPTQRQVANNGAQFDFDPAARQRVRQTIASMPHNFNFGNGAVLNSDRFNQLNAHNAKPATPTVTDGRALTEVPRNPATSIKRTAPPVPTTIKVKAAAPAKTNIDDKQFKLRISK